MDKWKGLVYKKSHRVRFVLENNPPAGDKNPSANSQNLDTESGLFRQVWDLAAPAFLALVAPAVFVLVDAAVVGTLGTISLAGLAAASSIFSAVIGLSYFLLTQTTSLIAQAVGCESDSDSEIKKIFATQVFHALMLGITSSMLLFFGGDFLTGLLGLEPDVQQGAAAWLRIISFGFPFAFFTLVATAYFRGQRNNRLPMQITLLQVLINAVLVMLLIQVFGFGLGASAATTLIAEIIGALLFALALHKQKAWANRKYLRPNFEILRSGLPLIWRSIVLRVVLTGIAWLAAGLGTNQLAAFHIAFAIWMLLALSLDALAIAAQVIVGNAVGAKNWRAVRSLSRRLLSWSLGFGLLQGVLVVIAAPVIASGFSPDVEVEQYLQLSLLIIGLHQPLAAVVFLLDGVLLGWADNSYMAKVQTWALVGFLPPAFLIWNADLGLSFIWFSIIWWLLIRAVLLWWRNQRLNSAVGEFRS